MHALFPHALVCVYPLLSLFLHTKYIHGSVSPEREAMATLLVSPFMCGRKHKFEIMNRGPNKVEGLSAVCNCVKVPSLLYHLPMEVTCFVFNKEKWNETELEPLAGC